MPTITTTTPSRQNNHLSTPSAPLLFLAITRGHVAETRQASRVSQLVLSTSTTTTMSGDSAALRVELKSFERDFKAKHGKDPSVEDIKAAGMGAHPLLSSLFLRE